MVVRPIPLRPPVRFLGSVRLFSGWSFVISSKVRVVMKRRPGDVGLYSLIGIAYACSKNSIIFSSFFRTT